MDVPIRTSDRRPKRQWFLVLLWIVAGLAALGLRAEAHSQHAASQRYDHIYYLPPPSALRYLSAGFDEAAADLIWMRALIYFGAEFEHGGSVEHVFAYAEAMVALDPRFAVVYRWLGVAGLYRPVEVPTEDILRAVDFMERGARLFPRDGALAWDIGASLVYELAPRLSNEEDRRRVRERGLPFLERSVRLGAAPEWAALSNASNLVRIGRSEQAARHLEEQYSRATSPTIRAHIADAIRRVRSHTRAQAFLEANSRLEEARRDTYPYLTPGMFLFIADPDAADPSVPLRVGAPRGYSELR